VKLENFDKTGYQLRLISYQPFYPVRQFQKPESRITVTI